MPARNIAYIRMEPLPPFPHHLANKRPQYRCTIELADGSTIMRCGLTVEHALENAVASYNVRFPAKQVTLEATGAIPSTSSDLRI